MALPRRDELIEEIKVVDALIAVGVVLTAKWKAITSSPIPKAEKPSTLTYKCYAAPATAVKAIATNTERVMSGLMSEE